MTILDQLDTESKELHVYQKLQYTGSVQLSLATYHLVKGELHRENGPAIEIDGVIKAWYLNDNLISFTFDESKKFECLDYKDGF
jgi:hypothetical protein